MALKVSKPPIVAPIITLSGQEGSGKTSLAAMFPSPVFMQVERVSDVFDEFDEADVPDVMEPIPTASAKNKEATTVAVENQVLDLIEEEHKYRTLVVDSVSALNTMFEQQLCVRDGVTNVQDSCGGYGKCWDELAKMHLAFIKLCIELRDARDMTVIFLSHLSANKVKNRPDTDPVLAFGLAMEEKSAAMYRQLSSASLSIRLDEFVKGVERDKKGRVTRMGKPVLSGDRFIVTDVSTMGYGLLCKNRWNLPAQIKLPVDTNPLTALIPYFMNESE